jgi:hypothetical protein
MPTKFLSWGITIVFKLLVKGLLNFPAVIDGVVICSLNTEIVSFETTTSFDYMPPVFATGDSDLDTLTLKGSLVN